MNDQQLIRAMVQRLTPGQAASRRGRGRLDSLCNIRFMDGEFLLLCLM